MPLVGWKASVLPSFTRIKIEEGERQDIMRAESLGGKLKKKRACLIKDHSSLSKVLLRSIFDNYALRSAFLGPKVP